MLQGVGECHLLVHSEICQGGHMTCEIVATHSGHFLLVLTGPGGHGPLAPPHPDHWCHLVGYDSLSKL